MKGKNPQEFEDNRKHVIIVWSRNEMETTKGKLQQQVTKNKRNQQRTELEAEMKVFWKKSTKVPKWETKQMEVEVKNNMQPMSRITK